MSPKPVPSELAQIIEGAPTDPASLYQACKAIDDLRADGTFLIIAARVIKYFCLGYRQLFYEPISDVEHFKAVANVNYALDNAGAARRHYNHITLDFDCFESALSSSDGRLSLPATGERRVGRHVVAMRGFDYDTGDVLFINSWGRQWGNGGYGALPKQFMTRHLQDAWLMRDGSIGWTLEKLRRLNAASTSTEFHNIWRMRTPVWRRRARQGGRRLQWVFYDTISARGCRAEVVDLRNGRGVRLGWLHVLHLRGNVKDRATSLIAELFVWPDYRRTGVGSLLEQAAVERALLHRSSRLMMPLYEADAVRGTLAPVRKFAEALGYTWRWGRKRLPATRAMADKSLRS